MTEIIAIDSENIDKKKIQKAAKIIQKGGLVAFPTETVYGLGADALNKKAVKKIFEAKGRPFDNPFIVHVSFPSDIDKIVENVSEKADKLIKKFWPGPLTLIFEKKKIVPEEVTAGLKSVAVRMPSNSIAHELIKESHTVIAAPSANLSGKPSPTRAQDVIEDLDNKVDLIIDGGDCEIGLESSVLDMTKEIPVLLRPGKISKEDIEKVIGEICIHKLIFSNEAVEERVSSPGMKYRHYSPEVQVVLIRGKKFEVGKKIREMISENSDRKIGVLSLNFEFKNAFCKRFNTKEDFSKNLFQSFRDLDKKVDLILVEAVDEKGIGMALMNRLIRASYSILNV